MKKILFQISGFKILKQNLENKIQVNFYKECRNWNLIWILFLCLSTKSLDFLTVKKYSDKKPLLGDMAKKLKL